MVKGFNRLSASLKALIVIIGFITVAGLILLACSVSEIFTIILATTVIVFAFVGLLICIYYTIKKEFEARDLNRRFKNLKK